MIETKQCIKCNKILPLNQFNFCATTKDKHRGECKKCTKEYKKEYWEKNKEEIRRKDRKRYWGNPEKQRLRGRTYRQTNLEKARESTNQSSKKYRANNRDKYLAHTILNVAVLRGEINRKPCVICGSAEKIHGHHEDYSQPLGVVWMCQKHHDEYHRLARHFAYGRLSLR